MCFLLKNEDLSSAPVLGHAQIQIGELNNSGVCVFHHTGQGGEVLQWHIGEM